MIGAMLRKVTGLPVVTTVHSDYRLDYMGRPLSHLTFGTINALALRRLDYRIGVSDAMVDLLISRGFPADRFYTIYNGIDFTPPPTQGAVSYTHLDVYKRQACGLTRPMAMECAAQTLIGAARLMLETGRHPGALKDAVCSPGGATIQGVRALEAGGFRSAVMEAVIAAYEKSAEMK